VAAKIGILGESTATTSNTTTTLYTVPADKAARVRIIYYLEGHGSNDVMFSVRVGTPGNQITIITKSVSTQDNISGILLESTPNPALGLVSAVVGMQKAPNILDLSDQDFDTVDGYQIAPLPTDYYLSTGDTVKARIKVQVPQGILVQVMGVEDDA